MKRSALPSCEAVFDVLLAERLAEEPVAVAGSVVGGERSPKRA